MRFVSTKCTLQMLNGICCLVRQAADTKIDGLYGNHSNANMIINPLGNNNDQAVEILIDNNGNDVS